ncbi:7607_t:CDS:2 [Rhizophagus irregularis]|nr:7607_t:CDS:2 [Rhizophagus irregularis]
MAKDNVMHGGIINDQMGSNACLTKNEGSFAVLGNDSDFTERSYVREDETTGFLSHMSNIIPIPRIPETHSSQYHERGLRSSEEHQLV